MIAIGDVSAECPGCSWRGCVDDCEPDCNGEGDLGCPNCGAVTVTEAPPPGVAIMDYMTAEEVARRKLAWDELLKSRTAAGVRFGDALWLTTLADN